MSRTSQPSFFSVVDAARDQVAGFARSNLLDTREAVQASGLLHCRRARLCSRAQAHRPKWNRSGSRPAMAASSVAASRTVRRERADVIERTGESGQPVARDAAVGRRDADHAAKRSRLPDGSAGIGAQRNHGRALRHRRRRAAARSAGHAVGRHADCAPVRRRNSRSTIPWRTRRSWSCR